jgi:hypothetical protein
MTSQLRLITASLIVLGFESSIAMAQAGDTAPTTVPPVPANLQVPAGHSVFFKGRAVGTQNFICLPTVSGVAWTFLGPQATLFQTSRGELHQIATHFLGANASENGALRPTWQHSRDSSRVWGRVLSSSSDPNFVEAGAIPWLLLELAGTEARLAGGALLTRTTFIHRVNTSGGIAPSIGCSQPADVGALALVPYVADYFFYREKATVEPPPSSTNLPLRLPLLRVVSWIDIDDVERPFQTDLNDGRNSRPCEVMHVRRQGDEPARLERLAGVTIEPIAHADVEGPGQNRDPLRHAVPVRRDVVVGGKPEAQRHRAFFRGIALEHADLRPRRQGRRSGGPLHLVRRDQDMRGVLGQYRSDRKRQAQRKGSG